MLTAINITTTIKPNNIVIYFDREDSRATIKNKKDIEKEGYHWIDTKNIFCLSDPLVILFECFKDITRILLFKEKKSVEVWRNIIMMEVVVKTRFWRDIFQQHNAKLNFQIEEGSALQYSQLMAVNLEGGISAWSAEIDPSVPTY